MDSDPIGSKREDSFEGKPPVRASKGVLHLGLDLAAGMNDAAESNDSTRGLLSIANMP